LAWLEIPMEGFLAMSWTDERVALVRKHYADGLSASQIAIELGGMFSRNAVIGKLHRLGLMRGKRVANPLGAGGVARAVRKRAERVSAAREEKPGREQGFINGGLAKQLLTRAKKARAGQISGPHIHLNATAPRIESDPLADVNASRVPKITCITELKTTTCRWPIGDVGQKGFGYCGDHPVDGKPYCEVHRSLAYSSARSQASRAAAEKRWENKRPNWASF
jgi:GcrA cell cycle regulator